MLERFQQRMENVKTNKQKRSWLIKSAQILPIQHKSHLPLALVSQLSILKGEALQRQALGFIVQCLAELPGLLSPQFPRMTYAFRIVLHSTPVCQQSFSNECTFVSPGHYSTALNKICARTNLGTAQSQLLVLLIIRLAILFLLSLHGQENVKNC